MKTFDIIGRSKIWLALSGVILVACLGSLAVFGLNFGIDFTGGSVMQITASDTSADALRETVSSAGFEAVVQSTGETGYFLRFGPFKAVAVMLALIVVYIAWAFRKVSEPVASWKYGLVTMVAAFHDVIIPLGVFAVLGQVLGYQVDTAFVAAILTVLGYSINDTIVVLDRTRENLTRNRHSDRDFGDIVNSSIVQTLGRSLNTTLTTLLPLTAIVILGGESIRPFALALMIGIASGAYSSIFVASPLIVYLERRR